MKKLQTPDYVVFIIYFLIVAAYGLWVYHRKRSKTASSTDYFLAEGTLTWWAIGSSLIDPNYMDLSGLTVLIGGMWIVNLNYWGCNCFVW